MYTISKAIVGMFGLATLAAATTLAPCVSGITGESVIPVIGPSSTYCVSDFGWSDLWLYSSPAGPLQSLDILSGDDALNVTYTTPPGGVSPGKGWLSPSLDAGNRVQTNVGSDWTVLDSVFYTSPTSARSRIIDPNGLMATIDTSVMGPGIQITVSFTNTSQVAITNLQLSDYFNFHPNGTVDPNYRDATTSYQNGCIVSTGLMSDPSFLTNGFMCGSSLPSSFDVGQAEGNFTIWKEVQNHSLQGIAGPVGPDDTAGALEWNLGTLNPGATVAFAIGKNVEPQLPTPEPSAFALMGLGLVGAILTLRRRA